MNITLGSDPELMILDTQQNNKVVSSIPILVVDKKNPIDLGQGVRLYADNILAEVAFPPAQTKQGIIQKIGDVLKRAQSYIGGRYRLAAIASHEYDFTELDDDRAWQAGCDPTFNAYTRERNHLNGFNNCVRTGSCHIHIGNERLIDDETRIKAIKLMDIFVGCASVIFDKDETAKRRREVYGQASEHRPTEYGLEYRCLGPYVLRSPDLVDLAIDLSFHALSQIDNPLPKIDENQIIQAINDCNIDLARHVLTAASTPDSLMERIHAKYSDDMYANWGI
jgi:hypothetical protein